MVCVRDADIMNDVQLNIQLFRLCGCHLSISLKQETEGCPNMSPVTNVMNLFFLIFDRLFSLSSWHPADIFYVREKSNGDIQNSRLIVLSNSA